MKIGNRCIGLVVVSLLGTSGVAWGAKKAGASPTSTSKSGGGKDFAFSLPLVADRPQLRLHGEYNVSSMAGIAFEGGLIGASEELGTKEIDETGNSLKMNGVQAALLVSRYSEPTRLAGFFWSLGAGYRQYSAEWKKRPGEQEPSTRLATADSDGYLHHRVKGSGPVGIGRIGYRFIPAEWPVSLGAHIGLRHLNSTVKDEDVEQSEQQEMKLQYSPINDKERKTLSNRMMTQPDFAVELGVAF